MGPAQPSFLRRSGHRDAAARRAWLARFGDDPPTFARRLLAEVVAAVEGGKPDLDAIRAAAGSLGVLRAQRGHSVAGLVEDLTALRSLGPDTAAQIALVDTALAVATGAFVDELTAILEASATRDPLTGLPNRAAFTEALRHAVAAAPRGTPPALLLVDLDGFKAVNDTDGHLAGDAVLVGVAALLRRGVRAGDLACRLGGDEFAVLLPRTSHARAAQVARRLLKLSLDAPALASPSARVRFSIGVGWLASPQSPEDLIGVTDAALYAAKAAGGGDLRMSTPTSGDEG